MVAFIDIGIVIAYLLGMIGLGYWGYNRAENLDDYLVAGRNVPIWMYVPVMSTVILGGASTIGGAGLGYQYGISGAWLVVTLGLGTIALGLLISTRLANLRAYTLGEVLERRFDKYSGTVGAVIAGTYALTIAITQTIAIGKVLSVLSGYGEVPMMVLAGSIVIAYTALGGMLSVTITDFIQWLIMTIGIFVLAIPLSLNSVGGFSKISAELPQSYFNVTAIGWGTIFSYILLYFLGIMIGQDIWQRVFTAKDAKTARNGNIAAGVYSIIYGVATAFLGAVAVVLFQDIQDPELALPRLVLETIPAGFSGIIFAGFISAMMSTAASGILASSTLLSNDVYSRFINPNASDKRLTRVSRGLVIVLGVIMIYAAVVIGNVVQALTLAYDMLTGSIFVPIFGAFFWKRATWQGALSSIFVSGIVVIVTLILRGFGSNLPILYGLAASLITFVAVSLITGPPAREKLQEWLQTTESEPTIES